MKLPSWWNKLILCQDMCIYLGSNKFKSGCSRPKMTGWLCPSVLWSATLGNLFPALAVTNKLFRNLVNQLIAANSFLESHVKQWNYCNKSFMKDIHELTKLTASIIYHNDGHFDMGLQRTIMWSQMTNHKARFSYSSYLRLTRSHSRRRLLSVSQINRVNLRQNLWYDKNWLNQSPQVSMECPMQCPAPD